MHLKDIVVRALSLAANSRRSIPYAPWTDSAACSLLAKLHPTQTFYPDSEGYKYEAQTQIWSASSVKAPACVFVPQDAEQVSLAVSLFFYTKTQFAVRGGGRMPVAGANSIDEPGVLLGMSDLTTLHLCNETKVISVGSGHTWKAVYDYLRPHGLVVVGGRVGDVGVAGLLLGGGTSFYSGQYGFASDNVVKYECVLANGSVVEVSADNEYSDLFWALKAGGNSFCIVTRVDLRTFNSSEVFVGQVTYMLAFATKFLDAVYNFALYGALDLKAALTTMAITVPSTNKTTYQGVQFYDSDIDKPKVWENFTFPHMAAVYSDYRRRSVAKYLAADNSEQSTKLRRQQRTFSTIVCREVLTIIHDHFLEMTAAELASYRGVTAGLVIQPITAAMASHLDENGGSPHNFDQTPIFIVSLQLSCETESEYDVLKVFADDYLAHMTKHLKEKNLLLDYVSMNDAGDGQKVFQGYGQENWDRLKEVREKYDPAKVYTDLMPGGWKVLAE